MTLRNTLARVLCTGVLLSGISNTTQAQLLWTVGLDDNGWPAGFDGGEEASFVQENGTINELPGDPFGITEPQGADNDYYFAGEYDFVIEGNGDYEPVGLVDFDEEAAERAFAGGDLDLRYHFNLPSDLDPDTLLSVTFDALNLEGNAPDPRFGVEVFFNNVLVQPEILIRPEHLDVDFKTPQFTLESVNAEVGPGADNIISLRGTSYNSDGGGNWMGVDYIQLDQENEVLPEPVVPWAVGLDDDGWPEGDGGGPNASFVQENGTISDLPGSPESPEVNQEADNDYYFAGVYDNLVAGNGDYEPVGLVAENEEAAERAFAGADNELRYHFNLPNSLQSDDLFAITYDALNLDTSGTDPRYGVEVLVNGVLVQSENIIRADQLNTPITTPTFSLGQVNGAIGLGFDNIVTLRGTNYGEDGGGNWMGFDYIQFNPVAKPVPQPELPWAVGINDDGWPTGNGGAANASFVQESGEVNPLPGVPDSPEVDREADNDYYLAGVYNSVISGNGEYEPVGDIRENEEAAERAFAGADNELRYHFNLPESVQPTDELTIAFDALNLQTDAPDPRYGIEIYVNNVLVQEEIVIGPDELGITYNTPAFTVEQVNAGVGHGFDNIVSLRGISYNEDGGGNWMGIDYLQMSPIRPAPFPLSVGRDDNGWPVGDGGGPDASFVQEAGINDLPGNPASPEVNQQADDDYYFAGEYTEVIFANGDYDPVGTVLVNEEAAERAFAGADNELRYHFNLPSSLQPSDELIITFDANNLQANADDPHYGVEVYFNNELVGPEVIIFPEDLDTDFTTEPFTLASVDAGIGPGFDNIITLRGINYAGEGGGNWMGIDYMNLDPLPTPTFPLAIGADDDGWPQGDGGGLNTSFVQEAGINDLPGNPASPEANQQADDDYYFAGVYTETTDGNNFYDPVGIVPRNEEAAERAFAGDDNELRYHFNLPESMNLNDEITISFDPLNLDQNGEEPRYGIEILFNDVLVQEELIIENDDLGTRFTTEPFTLASVNAELGRGPDNFVSLRGINYSFEGGGNWMGIDYVEIGSGAVTPPTPPPTVVPLEDGTSIAINFGADEPDGAGSAVNGAAGILGTVNWNNLTTLNGNAADLVADVSGNVLETGITVTWDSNNTWASQGRAENNNDAPDGENRNLMTGYLDTNGSDPNTVTVSGLPDDALYDVIVYTKGGVIGRGGDYTIGDLTLSHVDESAFSGSFLFGRTGDYLIFPRQTGSSFELTGTPTTGEPARAPINAIEILIGGGAPVFTTPPPVPGGGEPGEITGISRDGNSISIEFTGRLQSAETVDGPYEDVAGASSPFTVDTSSGSQFYIAR